MVRISIRSRRSDARADIASEARRHSLAAIAGAELTHRHATILTTFSTIAGERYGLV
jgi:hypothetical protein